MPIAWFVAQADQSGQPWFNLDDLFWMTVLGVFALTIIGALVRTRQRDKCLKLLNDHHVTYLPVDGEPMWGDLYVASSGLELCFDAPHVNRRGLTKTSTLVFKDELAKCLALCRTVHGLTDEERRGREKQIRRSFHPGVLRRLWRWIRNLTNTLRDAINNTLSMFVGRMTKTGAAGGAVHSQKGRLSEVGSTFIAMAGNAYEPLLERHIGKPVILELLSPGEAPPARSEIPGYLVDYSNEFIAVFSLSHEPLEQMSIAVVETIEQEGVRIEPSESEFVITCTGQDPLVVHKMTSGDQSVDLAVVLTCGKSLHLARGSDEPVTFEIERTRQIDIVCRRSRARIRFGSDTDRSGRHGWHGVAPEMADSNLADEGSPGDR